MIAGRRSRDVLDEALGSVPRATSRRFSIHPNFRRSYLVNGATTGIVTRAIDLPAPGRILGFPVKVRRLAGSVEDPHGFAAALTDSA